MLKNNFIRQNIQRVFENSSIITWLKFKKLVKWI
uniref:Uncharacterized protein n=1 Tax=Firmicutes phage HS19 TaxID=3056397 RepID=A0AA49X4K0_9VIRU|nr:MAG: hypothetical protein [Firmicutes phage HS19]